MKKCIVIAAIFSAVLLPSLAAADITSVTLTPATPTTLSNGRSYYVAGQPYPAGTRYSFRIQATDLAATGKPYWNQIVVDFMNGALVGESFTVNIASDTVGGSTGIDFVNADILDNSGGVYTKIDYTVTVTFRWGCAPFTASNNRIVARVTNAGAVTGTTTRTINYGVISRIRIHNFAQSIPAGNGIVTPWNEAFNVTGRIVYYDTATSLITTPVYTAEIAGVSLYYTKGAPPVDSGFASGAAVPDISFPVTASYFIGLGGTPACLGNYAWDARVTMASAGSPVISANTLGIICDLIKIDSFVFEGGGGVNATVVGTYYVRSVNVTGTRVRLRASTSSGAPMSGNTTFTINDGTNNYTVVIGNNSYEGTVLISPMPTVAAGGNIQVDYSVMSITGSAYGGGQSASGLIPNSGPFSCRWENNHPPGEQAGVFTTQPPAPGDYSSTATSFTLYWYPLDAGPASVNHDLDFHTYRIYYKKSTETDFIMVDGSLDGALLTRGVVGTPLSYTIGGPGNELSPLTYYDYRISAVDIFGSEVPLARQIVSSVTTKPTQIEASITDGITNYNNAHFISNPNPTIRVLRRTAIKVSVRIVTAGTLPDGVSLVIAGNDSDLVSQFGTGTIDEITNPALVDGTSRWSYPCVKVGANTYEGYIPSDNPLVATNSRIRMNIATFKSGTPTYNDVQNEENYWLNEWRFSIGKKVLLIPYPTRVLNNVLTAQLPCCYPAFFLMVDSLVTIHVYDVKGRIIATLCDGLYRPGGQNIKDLGWCGRNKDNSRVGPGLYYIHIKAVTFGNKTVLDKKMKVVVAH